MTVCSLHCCSRRCVCVVGGRGEEEGERGVLHVAYRHILAPTQTSLRAMFACHAAASLHLMIPRTSAHQLLLANPYAYIQSINGQRGNVGLRRAVHAPSQLHGVPLGARFPRRQPAGPAPQELCNHENRRRAVIPRDSTLWAAKGGVREGWRKKSV